MNKKNKGFLLVSMAFFVVLFIIAALASLILAEQEIILSRIEAQKTKALSLAEAGLAKIQESLQWPLTGDVNMVITDNLGTGSYRVIMDTSQSPCYVTASGTCGGITRRIRCRATFLSTPFEHAIYVMNNSGTDWTFQLRGIGDWCRPVGAAAGKGEEGILSMVISLWTAKHIFVRRAK